MIKRIGILLVAMFMMVAISRAQVKPFTIKGTITGKTAGKIYLGYEVNGKSSIDSTIVENGRFWFKGNVEGVTEAKVMVVKRPSKISDSFKLYISPGIQTLSINSDDLSNSTFSGTAVAEEMVNLKAFKADISPEFSKMMNNLEEAFFAYANAQQNKADDATLNKLKNERDALRNKVLPLNSLMQERERAYMDKYPSGYLTAFLLKENLNTPEASKRFNLLSAEVANSPIGRNIKKELDVIAGGAVGAMAPEFSSTELRGDKLSLSDYKGKYVLLDFWASWCVPCRAGNPHLLALYSKYKDKGFEIIGISDDDTAIPAWKKAIEDDKIGVWKHVLRGLKRLPDGGFDRSKAITTPYSVGSYPTKILIDNKGIIIGRYSGEDRGMDDLLEKIFK